MKMFCKTALQSTIVRYDDCCFVLPLALFLANNISLVVVILFFPLNILDGHIYHHGFLIAKVTMPCFCKSNIMETDERKSEHLPCLLLQRSPASVHPLSGHLTLFMKLVFP